MSVDVTHDQTEKVISRAIGEELRREREALGWSRAQLVALMPSGIGDRTLLSYEHGTRHLTMLRFIEVCHALGVDSAMVHRRALQRARVNLETITLEVDLRFLLNDNSATYRPIQQWARNSLNEHPDGVVDIAPEVVKNLAWSVGCGYPGLVKYLARFIPERHRE